MENIMKNKRGLELVASSSSAYKASSEKFLNWWWLPDQVWWRNKRFWVIPKITSANLCKPIHDIIISPSTILLNLERVEKKGKIIPPFIYEEIVSRDSQKKEDVKYFKCKRREYKKLLTKNKTKQNKCFLLVKHLPLSIQVHFSATQNYFCPLESLVHPIPTNIQIY